MKRLWIAFGAVLVLSFSVLGWIGTRIYQEAPPIPAGVVTTDGQRVFGPGDIPDGQNVWQAMGGMEVGSVWGHGSYVAPDWTADWLHRELIFVLNEWAQAGFGKNYDELGAEQKAGLQGRLQEMYRKNTFDAANETIVIDPVRARAIQANVTYFTALFANGQTAYAIPKGAVTDPERARKMAAFFWWSAWSASTNRKNDDISYTHNWPHEPLVGNRPTGESVMWTGVSILMLLAGISAMVSWYASQKEEPIGETPKTDPLAGWRSTSSQVATLKYFWVVAALILVQMIMGMITAHYGVEGDGFYGIPLSKWLPYSVSRTWHVQVGIFWIATAWLAAGLYIGPLVSGVEPKFQRLGVNVLFGALLVIVAGSLAGEWMSVQNRLTDVQSFFWGHQGYEYVDLGRGWQILLFAGLLIWLALVVRSVRPALKVIGEQRHLLWLFLVSSAAIGLFYGAGLTWGQHTNLSIVEYWRWWVVHLWVEGFFEVFATTVIAFFFTRLGLIRPGLAAKSALLSATIYLAGGIIGTCHHLYFSGTPTVAIAWGSVFSALEVVPLVLVAYAALDDLRRGRATEWARRYKWPVYYFVAVAFWNMVGAGLFGFMINPPIALYYMQGLNTTPLHGHAALFGVYGMLGIGLMLVCLRAMGQAGEWNERWMKFAFWSMNGGLFAMCIGSLLPVGLMQTWASVDHGYWYARSQEFLQTPTMQTLRWLRAPGDTLFAVGAAALVAFVLKTRAKNAAE
ncbi:nitric-oxide reductase large subunit [uncultured Paludibaculum sp.]|uniref:nitric-oxide reductase large subunit n=1 Tax=uncultured Paludibaculum sp. TaxID=1765020 RepID=UPI002AAB9A05|nr:nitric-oxide reductase large subunit [uncultured Paludibaculum sp.]